MEYIINIGILFAIYAILSVSLNLVVGYTGLISVGHAAFFGIGAYATALATTNAGMNPILSIVLGVVVASLAAALFGVVLSRFRDDYYMLASVGFNFIIFGAMMNWNSFTNGPLGVSGIPRPALLGFTFSSSLLFLIFALICFALVYLVSRYITRSSFGRALKAIREDEDALKVFGYKVEQYKLAIFTGGAGLAAVAGSLFAMYIRFIDPLSFTVLESIFILAIIILGGLGSLRGALIGTILLILLPEALRFAGFPPTIAAELRQITYGLLLVVFMLYRPQGLVGEYKL